jgi:hypothetical protein
MSLPQIREKAIEKTAKYYFEVSYESVGELLIIL